MSQEVRLITATDVSSPQPMEETERMHPFIPVAEPSITEHEISRVLDAVRSGWVSSLGRYLPEFEAAFASYIGTNHGISVTNGTAALHLALEALNIGAGDEVILPDLTFVATANAVAYTGATAVFADVTPTTWCLDPTSVREQVTRKTKAIIPVHLYGHPADMDPLLEIGREFRLHVVEDAAEAHGAEYKGRRVGGLGDVGVFSFYGNKVITTGEGGMLLTNSAQLDQRSRYLRDHAMSAEKRYWHTEIGFNYRMTNLQAALGLAQLERIGELLRKRNEIIDWYRKLLGGTAGVTLNPAAEWARPICWMVCVLLQGGNERKRDEVCKKLRDQGIDTRPFFYPLSSLPIYGGGPGLPHARDIASRGFNLPCSPSLSYDDVEYIATALRSSL